MNNVIHFPVAARRIPDVFESFGFERPETLQDHQRPRINRDMADLQRRSQYIAQLIEWGNYALAVEKIDDLLLYKPVSRNPKVAAAVRTIAGAMAQARMAEIEAIFEVLDEESQPADYSARPDPA